jgi:hypothetical protein
MQLINRQIGRRTNAVLIDLAVFKGDSSEELTAIICLSFFLLRMGTSLSGLVIAKKSSKYQVGLHGCRRWDIATMQGVDSWLLGIVPKPTPQGSQLC